MRVDDLLPDRKTVYIKTVLIHGSDISGYEGECWFAAKPCEIYTVNVHIYNSNYNKTVSGYIIRYTEEGGIVCPVQSTMPKKAYLLK